MRRTFMLPLLVAILLGSVAAPMATTPATASSIRSVNSWITLQSASPAVGCAIPVAVEVREAGNAVYGVDVLAGLVIDGEIYGSDRAVTGDDGLAVLSIPSDGAYAGGNAVVEVNLSGSFVGSYPVSFTADGGCESTAALYETAADIWWSDESAQAAIEAAAAEVEADVAAAEAAAPAEPEVAFGASIWVPEYVQQRNLSCEFASLTIATSAFGAGVSEYAFDSAVGWSHNPHWGYRGDINGWWGNTTDYGVYAEPLAAVLPQFGFTGEVIYAQGDSQVLINRLNWGQPTLVWLGLWGDTGFYETDESGTSYLLVPGAHVVVAYAYDEYGVWVSDPGIGTYRFFDWGTFMAMWNVFDGMALSVAPAA